MHVEGAIPQQMWEQLQAGPDNEHQDKSERLNVAVDLRQLRPRDLKQENALGNQHQQQARPEPGQHRQPRARRITSAYGLRRQMDCRPYRVARRQAPKTAG
jgi:hypothetical protein